jgi:hypothetical protein
LASRTITLCQKTAGEPIVESNQPQYTRVGQVGSGLALAAFGAVFIGIQWKYHLDVVRGPVPITEAQLAQLESPSSLPGQYVTLTVSELHDSEVRLTKTKYGNTTVIRHYVVVRVGDRWLVASVPPDFRGNRLTGYLERWTKGNDVGALDQVHQKLTPENRERVMPFQLNAGDDHVGKCWAFLGVFGVLGVLGLGMAVHALFRPAPVASPLAAAAGAPADWHWQRAR